MKILRTYFFLDSSQFLVLLVIMDTREAKEQSLTPLQEIQIRQGKLEISLSWLKWSLVAGFSFMLAGFAGLASLVTYLHSDTKQDIQRLETRLDSRIDKLESSIQDIRILLIQKQTPLPAQAGTRTSQRETKQARTSKR